MDPVACPRNIGEFGSREKFENVRMVMDLGSILFISFGRNLRTKLKFVIKTRATLKYLKNLRLLSTILLSYIRGQSYDLGIYNASVVLG
jgi:hypothetical protein